ncbi:integrase catalytic, partial [Paraphaeosphaeria sporulosa]
MASHTNVILITKATVILAQPADWQKWIFLRKDSAERNSLWKYVNPDVAEESIPSLDAEEPARKLADEFKRDSRETGRVYGIEDLSDTEFRRYQAWRSEYSSDHAEWKKKKQALLQFNTEIAQTIAEHRIHMIIKFDTPHARLQKLKAELSPTKMELETTLLYQYSEIKKMPKRANINDWLDQYEALIELMEEADLPDVKGMRAQSEFLHSVQAADEAWSTNQRIMMNKAQQSSNSFTTIRTLIQEY